MKTVLFFLATLAGLQSSSALGYRVYLEQFASHYDEFSGIDTSELRRTESCGLCHNSAAGGGSRNDYGRDFFRAVRNSSGFPGAELMDSDGDGFINLEEIYANVSPGKASSAPEGTVDVQIEGRRLLIDLGAEGCTELQVTGLGTLVEGQATYTATGLMGSVELVLSENGGALVRCDKKVGSFIP